MGEGRVGTLWRGESGDNRVRGQGDNRGRVGIICREGRVGTIGEGRVGTIWGGESGDDKWSRYRLSSFLCLQVDESFALNNNYY